MLERFNRFITPERTASLGKRLLPYGVLVFAGLLAFAVGGAGWEYTNRSEFCGTACHTMPPEYLSYLASPHANVKCVECHIGRTTIAEQFTRKAQDITHVIRFVGADYEVPIYSKKLRPASQICERCHNPEKFSPNSLTTLTTYGAAKNNELLEIHLFFKTGGTEREGRGKGIHWHIENKVEYIATDEPHLDQEIPWVRVTSADLNFLYYELEGVRALLFQAIQSYAGAVAGTAIAYDAASHPYFFIDTNGNGTADEEEVNGDNRFNTWTPGCCERPTTISMRKRTPAPSPTTPPISSKCSMTALRISAAM